MRITEKSLFLLFYNCVAVFRNILKIEFLSHLAISYHLVLYIEVSGAYNLLYTELGTQTIKCTSQITSTLTSVKGLPYGYKFILTLGLNSGQFHQIIQKRVGMIVVIQKYYLSHYCIVYYQN